MDKNTLVDFQRSDKQLKKMLERKNLINQDGLMMKEGKDGTRLLVMPDWIWEILAENLHYHQFDHRPASTILNTITNFLYTSSLKHIVEKVCAGCEMCLLESKVRVGWGTGRP